jgi:hypothetical protein
MRKALMLTTIVTAVVTAWWWAGVPETFAASERARLRAHFYSVEQELRARDVPGLTAAQRAARAQLLDNLHRYAGRGIFPRNTDFPTRTMPTFIDYWGKRCGVAYLMEQTGDEDMVLRIAATRNNAYVPELKDDPAVRQWLTANGVTLDEAARIQPDYRCGTIHGGPCQASSGYKVSTGLVVASNVTAFTLDALPHRSSEIKDIAALGTGAVGIIAGARNVGQSGSRGALGLVNTGAGVASVALGLFHVFHNMESEAPSRVRLASWVGARGAKGLAARVEF